jgi:hypothetical protein
MNGHETNRHTISYAKPITRGPAHMMNATIGRTTPRINT